MVPDSLRATREDEFLVAFGINFDEVRPINAMQRMTPAPGARRLFDTSILSPLGCSKKSGLALNVKTAMDSRWTEADLH